jgi:Mn2+/Fe2+ NRAMP family transporter
VSLGKIRIGPAILVTAAFVGPGTVMPASKAGSQYGFVLLWAVAFSVFTTIVLQEMAARLGIVSGSGLSQAIKSAFTISILRWIVLALVLSAILIGNAAYQTGNILGAASGVKDLVEDRLEPDEETTASQADQVAAHPKSQSFQNVVVCVIGSVALIVIWIGRFSVLQNFLTILVGGMSLLFVCAAAISNPNWSEVLAGFVPSIPNGSEWIIVGLIGTTVVPYNLFLHASAAAERWKLEEAKKGVDKQLFYRDAIAASRIDTIISILIGGAVTGAILVTAAVAFSSSDPNSTMPFDPGKGIADQLEPTLGRSARWLFAIGLCAAGLTSAITAPIAAGYAAAGCFGWPAKLQDRRLKLVATVVVAVGVYFGIRLGKGPNDTIILAQVANGLLLPVIAVFLLVMVNRTKLMSEYKNQTFSNVVGVTVILIVSLIAFSKLSSVGGKIYKRFSQEEVRLISEPLPFDQNWNHIDQK